jgi:hypothetical protein
MQNRPTLAGMSCHRTELGENAPQRADTRREGVAVVLDDFVKLLG